MRLPVEAGFNEAGAKSAGKHEEVFKRKVK